MDKFSIVKRLSISMLLVVMAGSVMACEISFKVNEKYQKETFQAGEEIIIEQKIVLTHRGCHVGINETKTTANGCEIEGATKWAETTPGTFERKLKVRVLPGKESEMNILCTRSCDKDGGSGKIILKKKS